MQTIRNFKPLADSIETIYMIEASPSLRDAQKRLLCGDTGMEEIDIGFQSKCKYFDNLNIIWCDDIRFIPKGQFSIEALYLPEADSYRCQ
jgi:hypothetical protein